MSAQHHDAPLTLEQYARLPEDAGWKVEAVRGRLVREPRPAPLHSRVQSRLIYLLEAQRLEHRTGGAVLVEVEFVISVDPLTVRIPDVAYVSAERIPTDGYAQPRWHISPDLAVEVASPANTRTELHDRVSDFLSAGTRMVWVVDPPSRTVAVYGADAVVSRLDATEELTGGDVLPGFRVSVLELFSV